MIESLLFAIGDVHGCAQELRMLLNELPLGPDTTVVFVGDYVDRGPDSKGVIDTILELSKQCEVVTLMGNHEQMFLAYLDDPYSHMAGMFIYNGGSATLESYSDGNGNWVVPEAHLDFLDNLRLTYETEHDFFVHAGLPEMPLGELGSYEEKDRLLWTRKPFLESEYKWGKMVVHGHSRCDNVEFRDNRINIDTGCVYRNKLSALALPGHQVISIPRQAEVRKVVLRDQSSRRAAVRFMGRVIVKVYAEGIQLDCETLDYSELGMYVRDLDPEGKPVFSSGQEIFGVIGPGELGEVTFSGKVVRVAPESTGIHYALQIKTALSGSFDPDE